MHRRKGSEPHRQEGTGRTKTVRVLGFEFELLLEPVVSRVFLPFSGYLGDRGSLAHVFASLTDLNAFLEEIQLYRLTRFSTGQSDLYAARACANAQKVVFINDRRKNVFASGHLPQILRSGSLRKV